MSGYVRTTQVEVESSGQSFTRRKGHNYLKKQDMSRFYIVLIPEIEGYIPGPIAYHTRTASVKIRGKNKVYNVRSKCLGKICPKCASNREKYKKDKDTPLEHKSQLGQLFMVYQVFPNMEEGRYELPEKAEPQLLEYWFKYNKMKKAMECVDWENLMDAFDNAMNSKANPLDPKKAVVFKVEKQTEIVKGEERDYTRTVYKHTALIGKEVSLPANYEDQVKSFYRFDELYTDMNESDMRILIDTANKIDMKERAAAEEGNPAKRDQLLSEMDALYDDYKKISNVDFRRILEGMEKKNAEGQGGASGESQGDIGSEFRDTAFSAGSNSSFAATQPAEQPAQQHTEAPATQTTAQPGSSPDQVAPGSGSRLAGIRAKMKDQNGN